MSVSAYLYVYRCIDVVNLLLIVSYKNATEIIIFQVFFYLGADFKLTLNNFI